MGFFLRKFIDRIIRRHYAPFAFSANARLVAYPAHIGSADTYCGVGLKLPYNLVISRPVILLHLAVFALAASAVKPYAEYIAVICEKLPKLIFIVFVILPALAVAFVMSVPRGKVNAEFNRVLSELDENETNLRDRYDAVFHLVTAADGAESYYSYANNSARYEDINTAREVDRKIISAWVGHSHLRIIDNSTGFDKKIERLIEQIISFVGDPEPIETERKYLVEIPDVNMLEKTGFCRKVNISQSYLNYPDGTYFRIRKRGCGENYIYIKTVKKKINDLKRVEIETRLTKDEYNALLNDATAQKYTLDKVRYCIVYKNQYFELDVFPFMKDTALLEIELIHGSEKIDFPPYIKIIREVTFDDEYKNYNIAKRLSAET